jgi:hypothetical protein
MEMMTCSPLHMLWQRPSVESRGNGLSSCYSQTYVGQRANSVGPS